MSDIPAIPNAVGRLDDFVEKMKQGETIKAAYLLDAELGRRNHKINQLKQHLANEEKAAMEIIEVRSVLSAVIRDETGMSTDVSPRANRGWKDAYRKICQECGREPGEWIVELPEPDLRLDERRVLATAVRIFCQRDNHEVAGVLANAGHCRGVEPYDVGSENE